MLVGLGMLALFGGGLAAIASRRTRQLRDGKPTMWAKFWNGSFARALGAVASFKLRDAKVPVDRATELAIAMSAEALFTSLPKETRQQLGDVPAVLHVLEERAKSARQQIARL